MAIPKEPAELEARVLKAGEVMRQAASALEELLAGATAGETFHRHPNNIRVVSRVLSATADEVLS